MENKCKTCIGPIYTMDHKVWPWKMGFFRVQLPWFYILKDQFTECLGPSLVVNRMWTKKNDHAPKSECGNFLNMPKKGTFGIKIIQVWPFSCLVFIFSSPIPFIKKYFNNISPPWALSFFLFCLSLHKTRWTMSMVNVGLIFILRPWTPWSLWHFFRRVNQSGPGTNSTTNHKIYKAFGWLHGP